VLNLLIRATAKLDAWARAATGVWWLSPSGLIEHQIVGLALYYALSAMGAPLWAGVTACWVTGWVHELTQAQMGGSDFAAANGGPANGLLDVVAFLPLWPIARLAAHSLS